MNLQEAIEQALAQAQIAGHAHDVYLVKDTEGDFVVEHSAHILPHRAYLHIGTAFPTQTIARVQRYDAATGSFVDEPIHAGPLPGAFHYRED